jgi:hypothetical protein
MSLFGKYLYPKYRVILNFGKIRQLPKKKKKKKKKKKRLRLKHP